MLVMSVLITKIINYNVYRQFLIFGEVWRSNVEEHPRRSKVFPQNVFVCLNVFHNVLCVVLSSN